MPENLWTNGATNGLWNDGDNWTLTTKPADGEDIVLNGTATASITGGFEDFDGADMPIVRSFHRHPNYTGDIGTSGDPLVLATQVIDNNASPFDSKGKVIVQGPGNFFYKNGRHGEGEGEATYALFIDVDNHNADIELTGNIFSLYCLKGRIVGLSGLAVSSLDIGWRTNPATDVHFTMQATDEIWSFYQSGGTLINTGTAPLGGNNIISSGIFDHGINGSTISSILQTGGSVIHRSTATTGTLVVLGGICDYSQDARAKTVNFLRVHTGAEFKQNANITIQEGGTILPITDIVPRSF